MSRSREMHRGGRAAEWLGAGLLVAGVGALVCASSCLVLHDADEQGAAGVYRCTGCHGSASRPGPVEAQAAPPYDLDGNTSPAAPGVGAHEHHTEGSAIRGPIACHVCHQVPVDSASPGHADSPRPAELTFGPLAALGGREPRYDPVAHRCSNTYCHKSFEPDWTAPRPWSCGDCHTLPPPEPHDPSEQCSDCHGMVVDAGRGFLRPDLHVNGGVDVDGECYDCHGTSVSFAPPPDLDGATDVALVGVGAHESHLGSGHSAEPVPCASCHVVPAENGGFGHLDDGPGAEVVFGLVATANGTVPFWDRATRRCVGSWCHGPSSPESSQSPEWTAPTGSPLACDACHALPPAEPHPQNRDCEACHDSVVVGGEDEWTFSDRSKHIDGAIGN